MNTPTYVRIPATKATGTDWARRARAAGFTVRTSCAGVVAELACTFPAGDHNAYLTALTAAQALLAEVPVTSPGTTWGSTSDGVGGHAALHSGLFELLKSGCSKRFTSGASVR